MSAPSTIGLGAASTNPGSSLTTDTSGLLRTVQGHVGDIRALIYCGVCVKLLYEPFTLACGHTFCYSCLTQWFVSHQRKKTCPDCRASVSAQPAPAYLIREIVHTFITRAELLENDGTTKEHLLNKRAETEKMESDKSSTDPVNGGLFQGCFKCPLPLNEPINDIADGVTRCPHCAWELEDGGCLHCGYMVDGLSDSDISDDDDSISMTDEIDDVEDGFSSVDTDGIAWNELDPELQYHMYYHHHHHPGFRQISDGSSVMHRSTDHSEDEDLHDSEMSDFIDDGTIDEGIETDHSTVVGATTIVSDSESDLEVHVGSRALRSRIRQTTTFGDGDDDDDEDHDYGNNDDVDDGETEGMIDDGDDGDDDDDDPVRAPTRAVQRRCEISSASIDHPTRLRYRETNASARTSVSDSDDDERCEEGFSFSNALDRVRASGSNVHSPEPLDDDSDVPVAPISSRRRGSRPGRIRPSQRRGRHQGRAPEISN
ncbi:hypothetical protein I7I51_04402 [Histoplasma capsulatum]|uniref:RING-type domain-containing protein n=1 Tax=Ajellomyces capsulatus TaxID=5037 RepID=A0A8A1M8Z2_AJECA|nr:hypothetical protein I7I51_04402 [Histoplasma capsulatum]